MKKLSAALLALLLILTGCQKQQRQADIRLPGPETPAAEETKDQKKKRQMPSGPNWKLCGQRKKSIFSSERATRNWI